MEETPLLAPLDCFSLPGHSYTHREGFISVAALGLETWAKKNNKNQMYKLADAAIVTVQFNKSRYSITYKQNFR